MSKKTVLVLGFVLLAATALAIAATLPTSFKDGEYVIYALTGKPYASCSIYTAQYQQGVKSFKQIGETITMNAQTPNKYEIKLHKGSYQIQISAVGQANYLLAEFTLPKDNKKEFTF